MEDQFDGPAARFVAARSTWVRNDWWRLESAAWDAYPDVRFALAFFSPAEAWQELGRTPEGEAGRGCFCLGALIPIAGITLPVLAAVAMLGWFTETDRPAPMLAVAIMLGVAIAVTAPGLITDSRSIRPGRRAKVPRVEARSARLVGLLHLVPSSSALLAALIPLARGQIEQPWLLLVVIADIVLGAMHLVLFRPEPNPNSARWQRNFARLEDAIGAAPSGAVEAVMADLAVAIGRLETSGLISAEDADRARARPAGGLGIAMAPREDLRPSGP